MQKMHPDREDVERLEFDREQDQALLAARGREDPDHLTAEEAPDPEPGGRAEPIDEG